MVRGAAAREMILGVCHVGHVSTHRNFFGIMLSAVAVLAAKLAASSSICSIHEPSCASAAFAFFPASSASSRRVNYFSFLTDLMINFFDLIIYKNSVRARRTAHSRIKTKK